MNNPEFDLEKFKATERETALQKILKDAERRRLASEAAACIKIATDLKTVRDIEEKTGSKSFRRL
ncbi:hypothetical protein [Methanocorpusculum sp. GPch4]|uniref:hypothetical protein n=1 Tax=Methanocorpusculum sp. GPch4 TaxID=2527877 RepID=UPI0014332E63|nr:hypothetical protein [Methanocorpusculum sp. GPch4]